jgi:hypothetical protein
MKSLAARRGARARHASRSSTPTGLRSTSSTCPFRDGAARPGSITSRCRVRARGNPPRVSGSGSGPRTLYPSLCGSSGSNSIQPARSARAGGRWGGSRAAPWGVASRRGQARTGFSGPRPSTAPACRPRSRSAQRSARTRPSSRSSTAGSPTRRTTPALRWRSRSAKPRACASAGAARPGGSAFRSLSGSGAWKRRGEGSTTLSAGRSPPCVWASCAGKQSGPPRRRAAAIQMKEATRSGERYLNRMSFFDSRNPSDSIR